MKTSMVLFETFPPDIRVENECKVLNMHDISITLICENDENNSGKTQETYKGITVHRVAHGLGKRFRWFPSFWWLFPIEPTILRKILHLLQDENIVLVHSHDLQAALTSIIAGRIKGKKIVLDLHENYPEMRLAREWVPGKFNGLLKFRTILQKLWETICCKFCDHIIVVVNEGKSRLMDKKIPADKISVIMNTVDLNVFSDKNVKHLENLQIPNDSFVICFIGIFAPDKGIDIAIKAMPHVLKKVPNARLLIVGHGRNEEQYKKLAEKLGISNEVIFSGWVDMMDLPSYIAKCDVGLALHEKNPQRDTTIPHKIFQYMAMGKPVLVSDAKPLARIVAETGCGLSVDVKDPKTVAKVIIRLYHDGRGVELGKKGRSAVEKKYNFESDGEVLKKLYDNLSLR
jgi:glycosyltransferase involved in cell wall biosynthesis